MKNDKSNYKNNIYRKNLIGDKTHRNFLEMQVKFGIEQRGGVFLSNIIPNQVNRLVADVNLLTSIEKKQLIFSGTIFNT